MKGFAVVVGIDRFAKVEGADLRYCKADAAAFADCLLAKRSLMSARFSRSRVALLTNEKATKDNVIDALSSCLAPASSRDMALVFIASHGHSRQGRNYIWMNDTRGSGPVRDTTSLSLSELRPILADCDAAHRLVFLDCCHSSSADFVRGPEEGSFSAAHTRELVEGTSFGFFNSCREDEVAYEDEKLSHGVWSHYLLQALRGEAQWPNPLSLSARDLQDYVRTSVFEHVKSVFNAHQRPDFEMKSDFGSVELAARAQESPRTVAELRRSDEDPELFAEEVVRAVVKTVAPLLGELGLPAASQALMEGASTTSQMLLACEESPVALLGLTGSGKTTLLNAVAGTAVGAYGGGGPQSAASLVVRHQEGTFRAEATYVDTDTLDETLKLAAHSKPETADLFLLDDTRDLPLSPEQERTVLSVLKQDSVGKLHSGEVSDDDLTPQVLERLRRGSAFVESTDLMNEEIVEFVWDHTNSAGRYPLITDSLSVAGPFDGLPDGVAICDLPGLGEINPIRVHKAKTTLRKSQQILIVTNDRGISDEIRTTLVDLGIIASTLLSPFLKQVIIVGTQIDSVRLSRGERVRLGLPVGYRAPEALSARFDEWCQNVRGQWLEILTKEAARAGRRAVDAVPNVVESTLFVPTSPEAYLCLEGLQDDPLDTFSGVFPETSNAEVAKATGIQEIRSAISKLAEDQEALRKVRLSSLTGELLEKAENSLEQILATLAQDLQMTKLDIEHVKELSTSVRSQLSQRRDTLGLERRVLGPSRKDLSRVKRLVDERWAKLDKETVENLLKDHVGAIHFGVIKAAMVRLGIFRSGGKNKWAVNVPEKVGMAVRTPLLGFADAVLDRYEALLRQELTAHARGLRRDVSRLLSAEEQRAAFREAFVSEARSVVKELSDSLAEVENAATLFLDELRGELGTLIDSAVGAGFSDVMDVAVREAKGKGARARLIEIFAEVAERSRPDLCDRTAEQFASELGAELGSVTANVQERVVANHESAVSRIREAASRLSQAESLKNQRSQIGRIRGVVKELGALGN